MILRRFITRFALLFCFTIYGSTSAQTELPATIQLTGMVRTWQQYNRCSAAAFTMLISYYGWDGTYTDMINVLNPHAEDVNVRLDEMAAFAAEQGLSAVIRTGGTIDLLRQLTAAGFPALVENAYYEGAAVPKNWMSHNRVVSGYDQATQTLYAYDSLLGFGADNNGRPIRYVDLDEEWRHFNRNYLVLYRPEQGTALQSLLDQQWDETANAEWTLKQAENDLGAHDDGFTHLNIGAARLALGQIAESVQAFDTAIQLGLPWRTLWYRFEPFEAYLQAGRYDDVITLAKQVLVTTPGVEEMYFYLGAAYEATGDWQQAERYYKIAVQRNRNFMRAADALAVLANESTAGGS